MTGSTFLFWILAAVSVASALSVVLHPHPVYCALALVIALFQIAALFVLLDAHMIAFLQVLVYAGAIMVLFLFVIMLLNVQRETEKAPSAWRNVVLGSAGLLAAELAAFFLDRPMPPGTSGVVDVAAGFGSVTELARTLFTAHVLSFEITSLLLLVAIVGAVVIGRRG